MTTLGMGSAILGSTSLSFLCLGIQQPAPEKGSMMNDALPLARAYPLRMIFPGFAITFVGFGI